MPSQRDYTASGFVVTGLVIILLLCASFVPSFRLGGVTVKRAGILSDVVKFDDMRPPARSSESLLDTSFLEGFNPVLVHSEPVVVGGMARAIPDAQVRHPADSAFLTSLRVVPGGEVVFPVARVADSTIVSIEDFSEGEAMMSRFYHALAYEADRRPVRIAVLGDSFIEADIITADMREQLQLTYGGNGVGFVPFSTPLSKYRGTVKHTDSGWTNYNLIKRKSTPEEYRDRFYVSGIISVPEEGATVEYRGVEFRRRIEATNSAAVLFVNRDTTQLTVTVNDSLTTLYAPPPGEQVQMIKVHDPRISSLALSLEHAAGFVGYGVVLEDSVGVSVHNYSVRSNSGIALAGTNYEINTQVGAFMNYDMVILQYGLNAMSPDVTDYAYYGRQFSRMINYIKQCFPGSAIVVMSVGDRSTLKDGEAVTMPAALAMIDAQRAAAEECGVGFWNTYRAMGGERSMAEFVKRKWAAKDYTHIGYLGGKHIAGQFVKFLDAAVASIRAQGRGGMTWAAAPNVKTEVETAVEGEIAIVEKRGPAEGVATDAEGDGPANTKNAVEDAGNGNVATDSTAAGKVEADNPEHAGAK